MSLANAKPSANYVPAYQASGIPYIATVTGGTATIGLKYITSEVTVSSSGGATTVNFGLDNSANFTIPDGGCVTFRVKTKKIVLTNTGSIIGSVIVSMTNIDSGKIPTYDQNDYGATT